MSSCFQLATQESNATRMSDAELSLFLSLVCNRVNVKNPSLHKQVVIKGNSNGIAFLLFSENSPLFPSQDRHKFILSKSSLDAREQLRYSN